MRKELYEPFFKDKKITVMGLGLLGRGIGDTFFLANQGAVLTVTDKKSATELSSSVEALKEFPQIHYHFTEHIMSDFEDQDFILKAAGVPYDSEYITHAKDVGVPVYMSAALVVDIVKKNLHDVTVVGITGTRGKSTTTELIAYILEHAGKRVHRGGNIRGVANLPLLQEIEDGDYLVMELDSWQLQGFGDMKISPDIAVFTSFLDDHLNYYKNDRELYFNDKANIFSYQVTPCLIASFQAGEMIKKWRPKQDMIIPEVGSYKSAIIGAHNSVSISLALAVAKKCGIDEAQAKEAVATFSAVPGRLEKIGTYKGVTVYNDNNATTPDAVIAGIEAVYSAHATKPIIILGGSDKGLPLEDMEKKIIELTKAHVLLAGTGTDKLALTKEYVREELGGCVDQAFALAKAGDVILFSPGFASFSKYFNNEYERNDLFIKEVKKYA